MYAQLYRKSRMVTEGFFFSLGLERVSIRSIYFCLAFGGDRTEHSTKNKTHLVYQIPYRLSRAESTGGTPRERLNGLSNVTWLLSLWLSTRGRAFPWRGKSSPIGPRDGPTGRVGQHSREGSSGRIGRMLEHTAHRWVGTVKPMEKWDIKKHLGITEHVSFMFHLARLLLLLPAISSHVTGFMLGWPATVVSLSENIIRTLSVFDTIAICNFTALSHAPTSNKTLSKQVLILSLAVCFNWNDWYNL